MTTIHLKNFLKVKRLSPLKVEKYTIYLFAYLEFMQSCGQYFYHSGNWFYIYTTVGTSRSTSPTQQFFSKSLKENNIKHALLVKNFRDKCDYLSFLCDHVTFLHHHVTFLRHHVAFCPLVSSEKQLRLAM